jgi:formyl transferase-like protein
MAANGRGRRAVRPIAAAAVLAFGSIRTCRISVKIAPSELTIHRLEHGYPSLRGDRGRVPGADVPSRKSRKPMLPHELDERRLLLPETTDHSIVLITGTALRHRRFAYRIQHEFGGLVVAWFEVRGGEQHEDERQELAEQRLFEPEVQELRRGAVVGPTAVVDPNSNDFVDTLRELDPYFFLSLGGPLYRPELLGSARGIAINQHAGWSPTFRGANTIAWALHHGRLGCVGATVHITSSDVDGGAILRRSQATLTPWDTPEACFARVVALGTELMCEAVRDIIESKEVVVYDQQLDRGVEYLNAQLDDEIEKAISRDFSNGWLGDAIRAQRQF